MIKVSRFLPSILLISVFSGCPGPGPGPIVPYPTPEPYQVIPSIEPSNEPIPTPTPTVFAAPTPIPELMISELQNGDLVGEAFQLQFGPGSKGVRLDFGPGSKGTRQEFGPGTKGPRNLELNITLPEALLAADSNGFLIKQLSELGGTLFLKALKVEFIRENELYASASFLPRRSEFKIAAKFHPGQYTVKVFTDTPAGTANATWSRLDILPEYDAELKVELFTSKTANFKPEDLDVEVLTQNRKPPKEVTSEPYPSPTSTATVMP